MTLEEKANDILNFYNEIANRKTKMNPKTKKAIHKALASYPIDYIKKAIYGCLELDTRQVLKMHKTVEYCLRDTKQSSNIHNFAKLCNIDFSKDETEEDVLAKIREDVAKNRREKYSEYYEVTDEFSYEELYNFHFELYRVKQYSYKESVAEEIKKALSKYNYKAIVLSLIYQRVRFNKSENMKGILSDKNISAAIFYYANGSNDINFYDINFYNMTDKSSELIKNTLHSTIIDIYKHLIRFNCKGDEKEFRRIMFKKEIN